MDEPRHSLPSASRWCLPRLLIKSTLSRHHSSLTYRVLERVLAGVAELRWLKDSLAGLSFTFLPNVALGLFSSSAPTAHMHLLYVARVKH